MLDVVGRIFGQYDKPKPKPNVVVVGYGWGGKNFCEHIDRSKYNVTVIDKNNYFLNTPNLVRFNDLSNATVPIEEKNLLVDEVKNIEVDNSRLILSNQVKSYDYLVVSTGSIPNTFGIKGAESCQMYKSIDDAKALKESLDSNNAYQIIGAGPSGIEVAFELATKGKSVTLIEGAYTILPNFSDAMREKVLEKLKEKNIKLFLNQCVTNIDNEFIQTQKSTFPRTYTLWMAGIKPTPLVKDISNVNEYLQNNKNVYVIGDSIRGHGPPTAQNAKQQGIYLANRFNNNFKSEPYKYNEWCKMLHTHDSLLIDYNNKCYSLPLITSDIADYFIT